MKIENFERVKQLVLEITDRHRLLDEIQKLSSYTGALNITVAIGMLNVYIPERYGTYGHKYLHKIAEEVRAEINVFTEELDSL